MRTLRFPPNAFVGAVAFAALCAAAGCRAPCEPGGLVTDSFVTSNTKQAVLVESSTEAIRVVVALGACKSGDVPPPKVSLVSPSGARYEGRTNSVAPWEDGPARGRDLVELTVGFREAGTYSIALQFTEKTRVALRALVAVDRRDIQARTLDVACEQLTTNSLGTTACAEANLLPTDAGPGALYTGGALLRGEAVVARHGSGSAVFSAGATFWVTSSDGGLHRYEDTGTGSPAPAPTQGLLLSGTVIAIAAESEGAWVLTENQLTRVEASPAALTTRSTLQLKRGVGPFSSLLARAKDVLVLNRVGSAETEACAYSLADDGGSIAPSGVCVLYAAGLVAVGEDRAWLHGDLLRVYELEASAPKLIERASTSVPISTLSPSANALRRLGTTPVYQVADVFLVPLLSGAALTMEAWSQAYDADSALVWAPISAAELSPSGRPLTYVYSRPR